MDSTLMTVTTVRQSEKRPARPMKTAGPARPTRTARSTRTAVSARPARTPRTAGPARLGLRRFSTATIARIEAIARRNERERNRVREVNNGFVVLRQRIPFAKTNKKMSKVETLRSAVDYIRQLQQLLTADESPYTYASHSFSTDAVTLPECSPSTSTSSTWNNSMSGPEELMMQNILADCTAPSMMTPVEASVYSGETTNAGHFFQSASPASSHSMDNSAFHGVPSTYPTYNFCQQFPSSAQGTSFGYY